MKVEFFLLQGADKLRTVWKTFTEVEEGNEKMRSISPLVLENCTVCKNTAVKSNIPSEFNLKIINFNP